MINMPIYVYEVIDKNDEGTGEVFEVVQTMSDAALTEHPETGAPVRRVIQPPNIGGKWSDRAMGRVVHDDRKLAAAGLTKYVKTETGKYEKAAGTGPDHIGT